MQAVELSHCSGENDGSDGPTCELQYQSKWLIVELQELLGFCGLEYLPTQR